MSRLHFKDELLDSQLLRALGSSPYGGADIGECLATARRIPEGDLDGWYEQWTATGQTVAALAQGERKRGHPESARLAFLRASSYQRTAGVMLMGRPPDARLVSSNQRQTECFRAAAELMASPPEILEIPFEGAHLPGYFFAPADGQSTRAGSGRERGDGRRATVVLTGGYDSSAEELYFFNGAAALARGYNVLAFDGPGQGSALLQGGLVLRADWETVVGAVLDHLLARADVDPQRVALIGLSLGAHLAPRAASAEHRLAACVADCGAFDLYDAFLARLPGPLAGAFARGRRSARALVGGLLQRLSSRPTAGWALRRGMLVHGVADPLAMVDALKEYTLRDRAQRIRCPTWVCNAEEDDIGASAPQLVEALTCEKEFVHFTWAEGAGDHCEQAARTLFHARCFGWLDQRLRPWEAV